MNSVQRVLFVDRMAAADAERVADVWTAHDRTDLPREIGVTRRVLFGFHGLYLHLVEADGGLDGDLYDRIAEQKDNPLYHDVRNRLSPLLEPFSPEFRTLRETRAQEFYRWNA